MWSLDYAREANQISLSGMATINSAEQINGIETYQLGPQISIQGTWARTLPSGTTLVFSLQDIFRGENSVLSPAGLIAEAITSNRNQFVIYSALAGRLMDRFQLQLDGTGRFVGNNGSGSGNSTVFEAGVNLGVPINNRMVLSFGGRYIQGSGTAITGGSRTISGLEGTVRTSIQF